MIEQYHPEGRQTTREKMFFTTTYDPIIPVPEVIQRFQRELTSCGHLCPSEEMRIRMLARRLDPAILHHLPSTEIMTLSAFVRVVTSYDDQRRRPSTISIPQRDKKHQRLYTPPPQSISSGPVQTDPSQLPQGGHQWSSFRRSYQTAPRPTVQEQPSRICPRC